MPGIEKGRIAVYDKNDKLLDSVVYYTRKRMRQKLDEFAKEYSNQEGNYMQVKPYAEEPYKSIKPKLVRIEIECTAIPICRPSPVYNNLKSIYNTR